MPRANRYILPGRIYHLTHRCHNREYLLRFAVDRNEYRERLRQALGTFDIELLGYCITSNHTHLLVYAEQNESISLMMQKLEGEFAEYYNRRKGKSGAFWDGRFHCTMIEGGTHLWNCLKYIDLNMVRAGVVRHPSDWRWCGYDELSGQRQRYRLIDQAMVLEQMEATDAAKFKADYIRAITDSLERVDIHRQPIWTENIAVGSEDFVRAIAMQTTSRQRLAVTESLCGVWQVREAQERYA